MRIEVPVAEALAFARSRTAFPPLLEAVRSEGSAVEAVIYLRHGPASSFAVKMLAAAVGRLTLTATFAGFDRGTAAFEVVADARGLPVLRLLPTLIGRANAAIQKAGVPAGLVDLVGSEGGARLYLDVQRAVSDKVRGVRVTGVDLRDGVLYIDVEPL